MNKAKAAADDLKTQAEDLAHKVQERIPDDMKAKAAEFKNKVQERIPDDLKAKADELKDKAEDAFGKLKAKVEDMLPGDKDGNGH